MRANIRWSPLRVALPILAALVGTVAPPGGAPDYDVPAAFATIQDAVTAAAAAAAAESYINITEPVVFTNAEVLIGGAFDALHTLTFRPDPDAAFDRATVSSQNGSQPIFHLEGASYVTFQDLDIVRTATNANNLIVMSYAGGVGNENNIIERCRIGSNWSTPGSAGWVYLRVVKPFGVIVRNSIFFSRVPANFDVGIHIMFLDDPAQAMLLDNNVVADHKIYGMYITDPTAGSTITLRNNVVANNEFLAPEPTAAYFSNVAAGVNVVTSHNTALASGASVEQQAGAQSILLGGAASFLLLARADADGAGGAFHDAIWNLEPPEPWNGNPDFFRLVDGGPLHDGAATYGVTVTTVVDDVERDARPSGDPLHTDRGADQIERGGATSTGVGTGSIPTGATLWASPRRNPSRSVGVLFRTAEGGRLRFEIFDLAGRRLYETARSVGAGEAGLLEWPGRAASGVLHYRVSLETKGGATLQESGRVVLIK
jgi:hypothetical protein